MANGIQGLGQALQAFGAGATGQLGQLAAQQQQQRAQQQEQGLLQQLGDLQPGQAGQSQALQQLITSNPQLAALIGPQLQDIGLQRQTALEEDAQKAKAFLERGDTQSFMKLANERVGLIKQMGGDSSDTEAIIQDVLEGDIDGALAQLRVIEQVGIANGRLKELSKDPKRKFLKAEEGRATFLNPDGTVSEEAISGALPVGDEVIDIKDFRTINNDVGGLIKEPIKIRNAASRLEKIAKTKSPTDQLAAIFTFMKALDPTSVVREGEQDAARRTGGVTDAFIGFIDRLKGEGGLPSGVFENMVLTAKRLANQSSDDVTLEVTGFLDAFGKRIGDQDKNRLLRRLPTKFELPPAPRKDLADLTPEDLSDLSVEELQTLVGGQ